MNKLNKKILKIKQGKKRISTIKILGWINEYDLEKLCLPQNNNIKEEEIIKKIIRMAKLKSVPLFNCITNDDINEAKELLAKITIKNNIIQWNKKDKEKIYFFIIRNQTYEKQIKMLKLPEYITDQNIDNYPILKKTYLKLKYEIGGKNE